MAVRFYDEALIDKIQKWIRNPNLRILKPDETTRLFQMTADLNNDKTLELPFIAISRDKNIELENTNKNPKTFDGFTLKQNKKVSIPINVIPMHISYQLDIYTKGMVEADEYIRNFAFNFINYPKLQVLIPYNDCNIYHNCNIQMDSVIVDNSDIREHLVADEFVRFTIKLTIDDAYLFSLPEINNYYLDSIQYEMKDRYTKEIVDSAIIKIEN